MFNLPDAVCTALVSVKPAVLVPLMLAVSLEPIMLTVTTFVVPSSDITVALSLYSLPATN